MYEFYLFVQSQAALVIENSKMLYVDIYEDERYMNDYQMNFLLIFTLLTQYTNNNKIYIIRYRVNTHRCSVEVFKIC